MRVFRNTTCTPTAPPPQQNSHICAHAPGQAVRLTNITGCSNLTGRGAHLLAHHNVSPTDSKRSPNFSVHSRTSVCASVPPLRPCRDHPVPALPPPFPSDHFGCQTPHCENTFFRVVFLYSCRDAFNGTLGAGRGFGCEPRHLCIGKDFGTNGRENCRGPPGR